MLRLLHSRVLAEVSSLPASLMLFVAGLWGLYFTDLFGVLMSHHAGQLFMLGHFLVTGYLFFWTLIGRDPGPRRPSELIRLAMMLPVAAVHAFFGVIVAFSRTPLAPDYYATGRPAWAPSILADQMIGGAVAGGLSEVPLLMVGAMIFLNWFRTHQRHAGHAGASVTELAVYRHTARPSAPRRWTK